MQEFKSFRLSPGTLDAIAAKGYEHPSEIQSLAIAPLVEGRDLIAQAQTGTGKTAAFGIPLVENHGKGQGTGVIALVLVPTRELALQVCDEITELARGARVRVAAIYGGVGFGKQNEALRRREATILVATPGRLLDHMQRGTARLDGVKTVVLDEADRMLDMGFVRDVEKILSAAPRDRQTALFSATLSPQILRLSQRFLQNPETVRVENRTPTVELTEQYHLRAEKADKQTTLLHLLHAELPDRAIVFTRTKHQARRLAERLRKYGWGAQALEGNMSQPQRERAMGSFRNGHARILVATDVAARGIDVPDVSLIVNHDMPGASDDYVHRIGRTARMGRTGRAFTMVQSDEVRDFKRMNRDIGQAINGYNLPKEADQPPRGPDNYTEPPAPAARPRTGPRRPQYGGGPRGPSRNGGGPRRGGPRRAGQAGSGGPRRHNKPQGRPQNPRRGA